METEVGIIDTSSNFVQDTPERKAFGLLKILNEDLKAADLKWSLFVAASNSFRHDTCLKPFPPNYVKDGAKDIDALLDVISRTGNLKNLSNSLTDLLFISTHTEVIDLLHYVLVQLREPSLKSVRPVEYDSILKKVQSEALASRPQYIFQVISGPRSHLERNWKAIAKSKTTFFAYHGSRLENFHSILHHGLQQHLNKKMVFGSGIYFSSELSVSLPYSPSGWGWSLSGFGPELSCVAMCELIDTPDGIYCQKPGLAGDNEEYSRSKAYDSLAGEVPHKYYVVSNNDLVRIRYLLVYAKDTVTFGSNNTNRDNNGGFISWISQHKCLTMVFGYSFILATIGLTTNGHIQYYLHMMAKKMENAFKGIKF